MDDDDEAHEELDGLLGELCLAEQDELDDYDDYEDEDEVDDLEFGE